MQPLSIELYTCPVREEDIVPGAVLVWVAGRKVWWITIISNIPGTDVEYRYKSLKAKQWRRSGSSVGGILDFCFTIPELLHQVQKVIHPNPTNEFTELC